MSPTGQALRTGIGAALRAERERRRTSLDAVARGTLVRQDFLELIEDDRLEELPSGAYAKGFIRSYANFLGLDPRPFIDAYENRCGRPEPELARVVQKGVRVPPAAQRRAWKVAIASAVALILLLGLLGAFRSGDEPADAPVVSVANERIRANAVANSAGAVVRLEVIGDETWVEVEVDGVSVFGATLGPGAFETFKADGRIVLYVARGASVQLMANGTILGTPGPGAYRGIFTQATSELPPNVDGVPSDSIEGAPTEESSSLAAHDADAT